MNDSRENILGAQPEYQQHELKDINVQTKELAVEDLAGSKESFGSPTSPGAMSTAEKWWIFEIFAWVLGTLGLIAIIIILRSAEGKPVPNWKIGNKRLPTAPLAVNINSVISIFSTLVKSTLLIPVVAGISQLKWVWFRNEHRLSDFQIFDAANKGPLGSIILLWTFRGKSLACLGAVIVIASLGLDFAFQQLVTYPPRPIVFGHALAPRANLYNAIRPGQIPQLPLPELAMVGAVYTGIYNANASFLVTPTCETGNCTWTEMYTSLGVCSKCYDITDLLNRTCGEYMKHSDTGMTAGPFPYCSYTLPSGQGIFGNEDTSLVESNVAEMQINGTAASEDTYFGGNLRSHITSMAIIRAQWNGSVPENVNATECGLDICVRKYKGSMQKSIFKEDVVDTFIDTTQSGATTDDDGLPMNFTINVPQSWNNDKDGKDSDVFTVTWEANTGLGLVFRGQTSPLLQGKYLSTGLGLSDIANLVRPLDDAGVNDLMERIAASMTLRMRQTSIGDDSALTASSTGQTFKDVAHVSVRWPWIAFPVTLVLLALVFLVAAMIENARNGAMLWKSNALAAFHHPLTKEGRIKLQTASTATQAEEIAKGMSVKWQRTDVGYRLVGEEK